jgi:hypothetical protein
MRKKQFGILLTVSLSKDTYELVKEISEIYEISMAEVVRNSIEYSMHYDGTWMASKRKSSYTTKGDKVKIDFSEYSEITEEEYGMEVKESHVE